MASGNLLAARHVGEREKKKKKATISTADAVCNNFLSKIDD